MATTSVTLSGFVFDNAGNAVQDAAVVAYTSADNATSAISGLTDTTDANGRWDITTADESQYPMDIKITFGSAVRWIKAANGINLTRLTVSGAAVFGENGTGVDVTMYGDTAGRYLLWDQSEDALHLNDSTELKIGSHADGDMLLYHDGTNSYVANRTGALKLATEVAGIAVTIGNSTSEVTVADNLTVTGNLTVSGTQTVVNTVTMNAANAIVFEGATANTEETTLTIVDPDADRTVYLPNQSGYIPVLAAETSSAQISTTVAELNLIDGGTARGTTAIADGDGVLINDGGTMRMTTVETLATYMEGEINALSLGVTFSGASTFSNTLTVGVDGTGYDVKFFGDTSSAFMLWDQSEDDLVLSGTAQLSIDTATDASSTTTGSFHTDGGVGIAKKLYVGTDLDVAGTSNIEDTVVLGTLTVGVDDTGHDVKFFGASAGAYLEWDESADQLRIMGASADATTSTGKLLLATSLTDINANDVIGKIDFQAPHEAGGTDAIEISASIQAIAQGTFAADLNSTDLIFYTGHSEAATEKFRFTSQGELGVGGANYGNDGQVLTSTGAGTAPAWEDATTGDITGVTAGTGLSGGGTSGGVTLNVDASQAITALTGGDLTIYEDANNADVSLKMGTSATESLTIQVLNGGSNKTAEEVHFSTATASGTADHGKMVFDIDGTDIATIDDGGVNVTSGSLETATIDYTDGDLAMTIADGGGVTFAQNATFSGIIDVTDATDASDATGDTGALRTEGGASIAKKLYVGTDLDVDGTAELDNITIAGAQGSDGQVLTSTGSGVGWEAAGGGGITRAEEWRVTADFTINAGSGVVVTGWELNDTTGAGSISAGIAEGAGDDADGTFTFPATGIWLIQASFNFASGYGEYRMAIDSTRNDETAWTVMTYAMDGVAGSATGESHASSSLMYDVTDTANDKVRFTVGGAFDQGTLKGDSSVTESSVLFIRLGDT